MSTHNYLDKTGLGQVWEKIKNRIDDKSLMLVTITSSGSGDNITYSADKTFNQIKIHLENKGMVLCLYGNEYYHIIYMYYEELYDEGSIVFESINGFYEQNVNAYTVSRVEITIYNDESVEINRIESSLLNTDISSPTSGQILMYNSTTSNWENEDIPTDTTRAAVSDVLTKTNTTSYIPTSNYHPATKKYVDDATANITDEKLSTGTIGNDVYYPIVGTNTSSATTKYIDSTGFKYDATSSTNGYARLYLGNGTASGTEGSKYGRLLIYGTTAYGVTLDSGSPTENRAISLPNNNGTIALTSDVPTKVSDLTNDSGFITSYTETDPIFTASAAHGITSSDITNWNGKANSSDVLTKTNTTSYAPTADYHPATKKYVDDATAGITSNLSGLTDTSISSPTNGQVLMYNSTSGKWENTMLPVYNGGVSS